jgi:uncharacterized protein YidB (DUF937 family)
VTIPANLRSLMGLFDSIAKNVLGGMAGGQQDKMTDALGGILNQVGGIQGLLGKAKEMGIEKTVGSWVSTGENEPVSPDQVQNLLGQETVQGVAQKLGFNVQQVLPLLAQFMPMVIDKLTPRGQIEQGATSAQGLDLGGVISSVLKSNQGGLGGLLGGLIGGGGGRPQP